MERRRVTNDYEPVPSEVSLARNFVRAAVEASGRDSDDAALVVSELVTNAVRHGRSPFTVSVTCDDSGTVIEVVDQNPRLPELAPAGAASQSGNGLHIVDVLARRWGVWYHPGDGKTVWAELK